MKSGFLAGASVVLTGHTGFKGAWLALALSRAGARVVGISLPPPPGNSLFEQAGVEGLLAAHHVQDVRDARAMAGLMEQHAPDVVFHLAAQSIVRHAYREPVNTFSTNIMGSVNVLEAVRLRGKRCTVIMVTSDKCYEPSPSLAGHVETDAMGGHDPYSASKGAAELCIAAYARSYFPADGHVRVASVRAGNVLGGGDWAEDRLVPDVVRALLAGRPVRVRSPDAIRPWQHVLDALSGYLALARALGSPGGEAFTGAWNFGPSAGEDVTVRQVVEGMLAAWGSGSWEVSPGDGPREAPVLRLDAGKARQRLGWKPAWSTAETVERTARWYADARERSAPEVRALCMDALDAHGS